MTSRLSLLRIIVTRAPRPLFKASSFSPISQSSSIRLQSTAAATAINAKSEPPLNSRWGHKRVPIASKGNGIVATRAFAAGDVVLIETPLAIVAAQATATGAAASTDSPPSFCAICFATTAATKQHLSSLCNCASCITIRHCSAACAVADTTQSVLCVRDLPQSAFNDGKQISALSTFTALTFRLLLRYMQQVLSPQTTAATANNIFQQHLSSLCFVTVDSSLEDIHTHALLLLLLSRHFKLEIAVVQQIVPIQFYLRVLGVCHLNVFAIMESSSSTSSSAADELHQTGSALFSTGSFFNHSCVPNVSHPTATAAATAIATTEAATAVYSGCYTFHALRAIAAGDELCVSYCDIISWSTQQRLEHLNWAYGFSCDCERCVSTAAVVHQP